MTTKYISVCDWCGKESAGGIRNGWVMVHTILRAYDFCGQECADAWEKAGRPDKNFPEPSGVSIGKVIYEK